MGEAREIRLDAIFSEIRGQAAIAERFIDRERYQILVCTVWSNLVLNPEDAGIDEDDLELVHDEITRELQQDLGPEASLKSCFQFITSKQGERAMQAAKVSSNHRDMLLYFSSMILDPEGHKRWSDDLRDQLDS
ncbi:MAG: hypothetical protein AAF515_22340 [Pseudomonadota bacterium]